MWSVCNGERDSCNCRVCKYSLTLCKAEHCPITHKIGSNTCILVEHLTNVALRARYHLCLPRVRDALIRELTQVPQIWMHIAYQPRFWEGFAQFLQWEEGFGEAVRDLAGNMCLEPGSCYKPSRRGEPFLPETPELSIEELKYLILRKRSEIASKAHKVRFMIDNLALTRIPVYKRYHDAQPMYWIKSLFIMPFHIARSGPIRVSRIMRTTNFERLDFITRSIFSQYVTDL